MTAWQDILKHCRSLTEQADQENDDRVHQD